MSIVPAIIIICGGPELLRQRAEEGIVLDLAFGDRSKGGFERLHRVQVNEVTRAVGRGRGLVKWWWRPVLHQCRYW